MDIGEYLRQQLKDSINQQFHIEGDIWLVPCVANYIENDFKPLMRPLNCNFLNDQSQSKNGWTALEDEILLKIVKSRGPKAWSGIAKELNAMIHDGSETRQGRHCRERWFNHVDPGLIKGKWSEEEDEFLLAQHQISGNRWSDIAKKLKGRNENSVKNRIKSLLKKKGFRDSDSGTRSSPPKPGFRSQEIIEYKQHQSDCLLLMSPQIVNYEITDKVENSPKVNFFVPGNLEMRPIANRLPGIRQITQTREMLRRDAGIDGTFSPSLFLR